MFRVPSIFYLVEFGLVIGAGTVLLRHLGAGTVPPRLKPLANLWVQSGRDPKWVRIFLWIVFWLIACAFFASVLIPLSRAVLDLGRGFK